MARDPLPLPFPEDEDWRVGGQIKEYGRLKCLENENEAYFVHHYSVLKVLTLLPPFPLLDESLEPFDLEEEPLPLPELDDCGCSWLRRRKQYM